MPKSRFFRVAVEGATTDGRTIDRKWLAEMAANYNRDTYAARVNMEHIRGITADPPFQTLGDVLSLKTEEVDIVLAGKTERKLALFAEIDALDPLVAMNKKGQKLYTSIEVNPSFADTGQAYLMGLAVTDSPASLGTEMLTFAASQGDKNPLASRKQQPGNLFTAAEEVAIELVEAAPANPDPTGVFASIKAMLDRFTGAPAPADPPVADPAKPSDPPAAGDFAAFGVAMGTLLTTVQSMAAQVTAQRADFAKLQADFTKLQEEVEATANPQQLNRPPAIGLTDGAAKTDC